MPCWDWTLPSSSLEETLVDRKTTEVFLCKEIFTSTSSERVVLRNCAHRTVWTLLRVGRSC